MNKTNAIILGVDPGLAKLGWCAVRVSDLEVLRVGLIQTKKSDKKLRVRASDDESRRARELYWGLVGEANRLGDVVGIALEAKSYPPNSSSSAMTSRALGVIDALAAQWRAPIVQASPQHIKKHLTGRSSAGKTEVQAAVQIEIQNGAADIARSELEHPADALGAVWACLDSEVVRALRRSVA